MLAHHTCSSGCAPAAGAQQRRPHVVMHEVCAAVLEFVPREMPEPGCGKATQRSWCGTPSSVQAMAMACMAPAVLDTPSYKLVRGLDRSGRWRVKLCALTISEVGIRVERG